MKPWLTENSRLHSLSIHVKNIPRTWKMEKRAKKGLLAVICLCWFLKNLREEELSDASAFHSVEKRKFYSRLKIISWKQLTQNNTKVFSWIDFTESSKGQLNFEILDSRKIWVRVIFCFFPHCESKKLFARKRKVPFSFVSLIIH